MTTRLPFNWKKALIIFLGVVLSLIFFVSILLNYLTNRFISSAILPQVNRDNANLALIANIQLFPWIKLSLNNVEYTKDDKTIIQIDRIAANIAFWDLFNKKLHLTKVSVSNGTINLYNIPAVTWKKRTKAFKSEETSPKKPEPEAVQKPAATTSQTESFFQLDKIELSKLKINYSASPTSQPIYVKTTTFDNSQSKNSNYALDIVGSWGDEPIQARLAATFLPDNTLINTNVLFADNELLLTAQSKGDLQIKTHLRIKNPEVLEKLLSIPKRFLPNQADALIAVKSHKLNIAPIQMVYPGSTIQASITQPEDAFLVKIILPKALLMTLASNSIFQACPLPKIAKTLIKGLHTNVVLTMTELSGVNNGQEKIARINIDGFGIQFEGDTIPQELQKNLQTCFDYKLENESTETTYSID